MKKKQTPQVIELTNEELEEIIQRVKKFLSEEDAKIIINIIKCFDTRRLTEKVKNLGQ